MNLTDLIQQIKSLVPANRFFREHYPDKWKESGNCTCFNHDDKPGTSLQVDDKFAWCHACNKKWDIIDLCQEFYWITDVKEACNKLIEEYGLQHLLEGNSKKESWTTYPYHDEQGQLLFEVVRKPGKTFKQRRPDLERPGEWIWKTSDTRMVLYHLPEVLQAEKVWFFEGEKDADNIRELGFTTTTSPRGAKAWNKHVEKYHIHEVLTDRCTIVVPDNDEPGLAFAHDIIVSLLAISAQVKLIRLPDLPPKGDASDFLKQHGPEETKRLLLEMEKAAPILTAVPELKSETNGFASLLALIPSVGDLDKKLPAIKRAIKYIAGQSEISWEHLCDRLVACAPELKAPVCLKEVRKLAGATNKNGSGSERFSPSPFVAKIREAWDLISLEGDLHRKEKGVYQPVKPLLVKNHISTLLGDRVRGHYMREIYELLQAECYVSTEKVNPRGKFCLQNGVMEFTSKGINFVEKTSDYFTIQAKFPYKPDAKCPLWLESLQDVQPDPEMRRLIQQIFGYCFSSRKDFELGFIFYGDGHNGKSLVTETIEGIVGKDNCGALTLEDLADKFRPAELEKKLVNITDEKDAKGLVNDEALKKVISNHKRMVEQKYGRPYEYRTNVFLIVACNNLPKTTDKSYGWARRWVILPFTERVPQEKRDRQRAKRIIATEAAGVFNWAMEGYLDLLKEDRFILPAIVEKAKEEYLEDIDHTIEYVTDLLSITGDHTETEGELLKALYVHYQRWAKDSGYKPNGKKQFSKLLAKHLYRDMRKRKEGWYFPGVWIKPE